MIHMLVAGDATLASAIAPTSGHAAAAQELTVSVLPEHGEALAVGAPAPAAALAATGRGPRIQIST